MSARAAILLVLALGGLASAYVSGLLLPLIEADATSITPGLIFVACVCTALANTRRNLLVWVIDHQICPMLGLLGTVLGFMAALEGITGDITAAKLAGVDTALVTTAAGMVAHIWLLVVREGTRQ